MTELPKGPASDVIAAVTALAFLVILIGGLSPLATPFAGFVPGRLTGAVIVPDALPVWLTPLSSTLVHGAWFHLLFNVGMIVYLGRFVEQAIGSVGVIVIYVVGAYASALLHWAIAPGSAAPLIGASGAASAVAGAYAVFYGRDRMDRFGPLSPFVVRVLWLASAWIFVQALIGIASFPNGQVAIFAHIGGFIAGLALARPLLIWRYRRA